jgi:hypothetical protein
MVGIHGAAEGTPSNFIEFITVHVFHTWTVLKQETRTRGFPRTQVNMPALNRKERSQYTVLQRRPKWEFRSIFYVFTPFWEGDIKFRKQAWIRHFIDKIIERVSSAPQFKFCSEVGRKIASVCFWEIQKLFTRRFEPFHSYSCFLVTFQKFLYPLPL